MLCPTHVVQNYRKLPSIEPGLIYHSFHQSRKWILYLSRGLIFEEFCEIGVLIFLKKEIEVVIRSKKKIETVYYIKYIEEIV